MKKLNKVVVVILVLFAFAAVSLTAYAITFNNPAEIVSNGAIAYDEGEWEQFREEMLKSKKAYLDEMVDEGVLTQEEADEYYNSMVKMHEYNNSTGGYGRGMGCGFGGRGMMGFGGRGMMGFGGRGMGRNWQ